MKPIVVLFLLSLLTLKAIAEKDDSSKEWKWHYYVQAGPQWSSHRGVDVAVHFVFQNRWFVGGRVWMSDYSTNQYPKLETFGPATGYPYSHEEFAFQTGWFHQLNKQWFFTLDAGPSYVRYFYPSGTDSLLDDKHSNLTTYEREEKTAMGWAFSGNINWHHDVLSIF